MKKVSIIIPVYNTEKYLDKCVTSIVNQAYSNLEILLIDDGSTDNSGELCDEWAKKDKRIKVFHKKNGGLSDARNYGIRHATGDYVGFVDSDDWVSKNMYSSLIKECERYNLDIGCCNRIRAKKTGNKVEKAIVEDKILSKEGAFAFILLCLDPSVCNKIFRIHLFDENKFPKGKLYEDIGTIYFLVNKSNGMYLKNISGYYYNQQNDDSIVRKKFTIDKMDYYYHSKKMCDFITSEYPDLVLAAEYFLGLSITSLITDMFPYRKKYRKEYKLLLEKLRETNCLKNKYVPAYKKIMIFLDLYRMGWVVNMVKKMRIVCV